MDTFCESFRYKKIIKNFSFCPKFLFFHSQDNSLNRRQATFNVVCEQNVRNLGISSRPKTNSGEALSSSVSLATSLWKLRLWKLELWPRQVGSAKLLLERFRLAQPQSSYGGETFWIRPSHCCRLRRRVSCFETPELCKDEELRKCWMFTAFTCAQCERM